MNITLFSENDKWFWVLQHDSHELMRSLAFQEFTLARRSAERFRIGAGNPLIINNRDALKSTNNIDDDFRNIFLVSLVNNQWIIEVLIPENVVLTCESIHSSKACAEAYIASLSNDVFECADLVNNSGCTLHPLQYSLRYREMFGIKDEHPSSK
ncbi:hypothetical protein [Trabulsiella odontotermitis]|uniref:hypothetical protein n=1 Tax=Trabulsiella odontotermitis TaxID=379893 RepID=UPI00092CE490|nr:hypothetical protein [Trabulsiella odontotermitis]